MRDSEGNKIKDPKTFNAADISPLPQPTLLFSRSALLEFWHTHQAQMATEQWCGT